MTISIKRVVIASLILFLLIYNSAFATVCRLPGLDGFDKQNINAKVFLPPNTRTLENASLYIENTKHGLYFQSNYITKGHQYPTKIGGEDIIKGEFAFTNIVFDSQPSSAEWIKTDKIFRGSVEVILDESMFDKHGKPLVDLQGVENIKIVNKSTRSVIHDKGLETLNRSDPPPLIIKKILGCCIYSLPMFNFKDLIKGLKSKPVNKKEIKVLSLVNDTATEVSLRESNNIRTKNILGKDVEINELKDVENILKSESGSDVILVGHFESGDFVTKSSSGKELFRAGEKEIRKIAEKYNINLIQLGCKTAEEININTMEVGVVTTFNSVDAIKSIDRALNSSTNQAEFLETLTSEGLKIIITDKYASKEMAKFGIYSKHGFKNIWVKVADIIFSLRGKE